MAGTRVNIQAAAGEVGQSPAGLAGIVRTGISEGWSQRTAIAVAREAGLSFRDSTFRALWRDVNAQYARAEQVAATEAGSPVALGAVTETDYGKAGTFNYWIVQYFRDRQSGDILSETFTLDSPDLLSPDEAIAQLTDRLDNSEEADEYEAVQQRLGFALTGITTRAEVA